MAQVQIADVVVPSLFTAYQVENSLRSTALFQSGVVVRNSLMDKQLSQGSNNFTVPFWQDLPDVEADITTDNPADIAVPQKINAKSQTVRKAFLHQSWSEMSLASELAGSSALDRIKDRVLAYWDRQFESRLIASLLGVLYSNVANNGSDMVVDMTANPGGSQFNGLNVISAALTLGDRLSDVKSIAMHSKNYAEALANDEIAFFKPSENDLAIPTYKGLSVSIDDNLVTSTPGVYVTVLFGPGAIGYGVSEPEGGFGTELFRVPAAGNGGGQSVLHSRTNVAIHPLGFAFNGSAVAGESPSLAELANPANWTRAVTQRKSVPLAFLITK